MKKILPLLLVAFLMVTCKSTINYDKSESVQMTAQSVDSSDLTNNFYDNVETISLPTHELTIAGEILNPGTVDFSRLEKRSVIVKEALLDDSGGNRFTGAFRYDGYSLFDILNDRIINKANAEEFPQVIDLFVEIENAAGEKVVFSWGEIYYPADLHKIILATDVARIVPSKTKELWTLPVSARIVSGNDLITERNISDPVRITVRSYPKSFVTIKGMSPMYSDAFSLYTENNYLSKISDVPASLNENTYNTVFYGRGKGIHSTSPFSGVFLRSVLEKFYPSTRQNLMTGLFCFAAKDGYRMTVSYSELFNRNDQQEFLLTKSPGGEDGGLFRIFPAPDFFSDRSIKSLKEVHFINITGSL
jgi:hypothetical protein